MIEIRFAGAMESLMITIAYFTELLAYLVTPSFKPNTKYSLSVHTCQPLFSFFLLWGICHHFHYYRSSCITPASGLLQVISSICQIFEFRLELISSPGRRERSSWSWMIGVSTKLHRHHLQAHPVRNPLINNKPSEKSSYSKHTKWEIPLLKAHPVRNPLIKSPPSEKSSYKKHTQWEILSSKANSVRNHLIKSTPSEKSSY